MFRVGFACCVLLITSSISAQDSKHLLDNWHQFRGPVANGFSPNAKPPTTWSETENIKWKASIEGLGSSTPIIWENKIFLLTAVKTDRIDPKKTAPEKQGNRAFGIKFPNQFYEFVIVCLDRQTGKEIWKKTANVAVPNEGVHPDNNFASSTPTTDGKFLYVPFGSQGFYCYDMDGNQVWKRDLGPVETRRSFGEGASLTLHEDKLVILRDNENQSQIEVVNKTNGKTIWKKERDEPTAWATPVVVQAAGKLQLITSATNFVRSYDLNNGDLIWQCGGQVTNVTPSPMIHGDTAICMSGYRGSIANAIKLDSKGDVTGDSKQVKWSVSKGTPYIPSGMIYGEQLYFTQSNRGILTCLNATTGKVIFERQRVDGVNNIYASLVGADGKIFVTDRRGTVTVLDAGKEYKVLAQNKLSDSLDATPVLVGGEIYLRGKNTLYCISKK